MLAASPAPPRTHRTPAPDDAVSGRRDTATTSSPPAASSSTSTRPTFPVAPVTVIITNPQ